MMKRDDYVAKTPKVEFESEDTELLNSTTKNPRLFKAGAGGGYSPLAEGQPPPNPLLEKAEEQNTLSDKWILSRANRAARDVRAAFDRYEINEVTKVLYDFIWGDFCDWYLEIVKLQPESTPLAVEILEGILRMLHPIMPFISEELWHALTGEPLDVLLGRDDYISPDNGKIDDKVEEQFAFLQKTIEAIRLVRSTLKLPPSKAVHIIVQAKDAKDLSDLRAGHAIIERLGRASELRIETEEAEYSSMEYASELIGGRGRVFIQLGQRSDEDRAKEHRRLAKELGRVESQWEAIKLKLSNDSFVSRAPASVIEKEQEKQASYQFQIEKLRASLEELALG
jgi:valyl-tRNA synthetase